MGTKELRRRLVIPVMGLLLALYYILVFLPLSRRTESLDVPLQKAWQKLAASLDQTNAASIDFLRITNQLDETRQELKVIQAAKQSALSRLALDAALKSRLDSPFELVEYENERSKQMDRFVQLASQAQVKLDMAVINGFPDYTMDVRQPELLWAELAFIDALLSEALQSKVSAIHSLDLPSPLTNSPANGSVLTFAEIPLQIELTAPAASISRLLQVLPLRSDEVHAAGLTTTSTNKPLLFLDRLLIKKQNPEKPDEVHISLRTAGFVPRE